MTIAEQLRTEGWQEGQQQGENRKAHQIAANLLKAGIPINVIVDSTGLPLDEIKRLKAETEHYE